MKITIRILVCLFLILNSCSSEEKECEVVTQDNYSVEIAFSSFFDCGIFERIVMTTRSGPLTYSERFKLDILYKIAVKDNCTKPVRDTVIFKPTKVQRDSIFDLANRYLEGVKFDIRTKDCLPNVKEVVMDGGNIEIKLCFDNQCKSYAYYHYGHLNEISTDLNVLISYIDKLK